MSVLSRRHFFLAGAVGLTTPLWPKLAVSANPDVIVIGAGAAGIAAAKALMASGRSVTVIEAGKRIGGRVFTETSTFGVPFDVGALWLHNARGNPFVGYGQKNGFTVYPAPDEETLYVGDREADDDGYIAYDTAYRAAIRAISSAGAAGRDVSAASVVSEEGDWSKLVHLAIGPYEMGKDLDSFSCKDWYNSNDGKDWFCREGYGAIWAHSAQGIPVQLSTTATSVKWGGHGVTVETNRGSLSAKACIVTVSTGVLAQEALRFDPPLSPEKQASFHGISMGLYNHIALQFNRNIFGTGKDGYLYSQIDSEVEGSPKGMGLLTNVSGGTLSYGDVGGRFAAALEAEGEAAAIDFALSDLRRMFGSDVDKAFVKGVATNWGQNPLTYGSYASAEPGKYPLRAVLRQPVGERIWFAGEACSPANWATVVGAHESGEAAGSHVGRFLRA